VVEKSFAKFWNASAGYCYDVIDSTGVASDPTLRPNQIFAVSLPQSLAAHLEILGRMGIDKKSPVSSRFVTPRIFSPLRK